MRFGDKQVCKLCHYKIYIRKNKQKETALKSLPKRKAKIIDLEEKARGVGLKRNLKESVFKRKQKVSALKRKLKDSALKRVSDLKIKVKESNF